MRRRGTASMGGGAPLAIPGDLLTVTFSPALPDLDCFTINLDGMTTAAGVALADSTFRAVVLHGDIDQNGVVSTGDASIIKPQFGAPPSATNLGFNYNHDSVVSTGDASLIKPLFGNSAPACP